MSTQRDDSGRMPGDPTPRQIEKLCRELRRRKLELLSETPSRATAEQLVKLTRRQVRQIQALLLGGWRTQSDVARLLKLPYGAVHQVAHCRHPLQKAELAKREAAEAAERVRLAPLLRLLPPGAECYAADDLID